MQIYARKQIRSCEEGIPGGWEEEMIKGQQKTFWGDRCVHYLDCSDVFMSICICQNYQTTYIKYEQFTVCKLDIHESVKHSK